MNVAKLDIQLCRGMQRNLVPEYLGSTRCVLRPPQHRDKRSSRLLMCGVELQGAPKVRLGSVLARRLRLQVDQADEARCGGRVWQDTRSGTSVHERLLVLPRLNAGHDSPVESRDVLLHLEGGAELHQRAVRLAFVQQVAPPSNAQAAVVRPLLKPTARDCVVRVATQRPAGRERAMKRQKRTGPQT